MTSPDTCCHVPLTIVYCEQSSRVVKSVPYSILVIAYVLIAAM